MRWPFSRKEAPPGYDELADRIDKLERQQRMLELEWESVYNKVRSILGRLNKREERAATESDERAAAEAIHNPLTRRSDGGDDIDRIIALRRGRRP